MNNKKITISFSVSVYTIIACAVIVVLAVTNVAFAYSYVRAERAYEHIKKEHTASNTNEPSYPAILVTH